MTKDRLYLLEPDFIADGVNQFCTECAMVEGMLSFYPHLRSQLDIKYIRFARPRPEIVAELGPEHQSSPCLVVADPATAARLAPGVRLQHANGKAFLNDPYLVCDYIAATLKAGQARR